MKLIEYENIVMPIKQYVQGALIGKSTIMRQGFHTSAQIHGYLDGDLLADPIQVLYDYVDTHPPANDLKYVIRLAAKTYKKYNLSFSTLKFRLISTY